VQVSAVAYDNPIPGFKTNNTINLRLWAAKPDREFDLEAFNTGDYVQVCTLSELSRKRSERALTCMVRTVLMPAQCSEVQPSLNVTLAAI